MTTPARDDVVERAFEAALAGRPAPTGESGLVAFTEAVRASATAPGRPSAALAELLVTGLLTDQSSPSAATARSAGRDASQAPARGRRRRIRMLAPALFSKIAAAGLAAKAATVAGVAVVGLSTAGFVGALPTSAQHAFATVVDHATPFTAPDAPATTSPTTDATTTPTTPTSTTDGQTATTTDPAAPTAPATATDAPFGQQVSQMAHDNKAAGHPGVDGQAVSSLARARHSTATEDPSGDTADQSGDPTTTEGDGSGDTGSTQPSTDGSSRHGKSGSAGHGNH
jgi:hypothetical protein